MDVRVPVFGMDGRRLADTTPYKAKMLLKKGKATVVGGKEFSIRLRVACGNSGAPALEK